MNEGEEDPSDEARPAVAQPGLGTRLNRAFGPVVAGLIIDLLDLSTFGPMGLIMGLPIGGGAGYWMGRCLGFSRRTSLVCALAAGVYCMIPFTELLPLATLLGAFVRFRAGGRKTEPDEASSAEGDDASTDGGTDGHAAP